MNRKKFFALVSSGLFGIALLKTNPLKLVMQNKGNYGSLKVKMNPNAVKREKTGKING
jgi:hypothetical protein